MNNLTFLKSKCWIRKNRLLAQHCYPRDNFTVVVFHWVISLKMAPPMLGFFRPYLFELAGEMTINPLWNGTSAVPDNTNTDNNSRDSQRWGIHQHHGEPSMDWGYIVLEDYWAGPDYYHPYCGAALEDVAWRMRKISSCPRAPCA